MDRKNQYRLDGRRNKHRDDPPSQSSNQKTWRNPPHVPGIHATYRSVHKSMRPLLWGTYVIMGLMGAIFILICLNAGLSPGMLDPDTGTVRWVSDGFKVSIVKSTLTYRVCKGSKKHVLGIPSPIPYFLHTPYVKVATCN